MATNKHAMIRYQVLDRCFSNWARNFYIEDLIEACNKALYDYTGDEKSSIQRRQIFNDISFMESGVAATFADALEGGAAHAVVGGEVLREALLDDGVGELLGACGASAHDLG